jgi:hypothetical protein
VIAQTASPIKTDFTKPMLVFQSGITVCSVAQQTEGVNILVSVYSTQILPKY